MRPTTQLSKAVKTGAVSLLGTRAVAGLSRRLTGSDLRVLAYHDVPDRRRFEVQLDNVIASYNAVSGADVASARAGRTRLPERPLWITFDEGYSNVVELALPLLAARGLSATMFVSPGMSAGQQATPWWIVVDRALELGWCAADRSTPSVTHLKRVHDSERREIVDSARRHLESLAEMPVGVLANEASLQEWLSMGMELGNHTWDHPCLNRCEPQEQLRQIESADSWLRKFGAFENVKLFAYPNGDWTQASEEVLRGLGYDIGVLFDHRLERLPPPHPLRVSRLRIDADASESRCRSIVSGAHSFCYRPSRVGFS
jgi:peptidoglycan/xylan/chitin deacetylase (PgdA/CDA1 family)